MSAYRLAAGTLRADQMTSAYDVTAWPVQTDQGNKHWAIVSPSGFFNQYDAFTEGGLDGTIRGMGNWNGAWFFGLMTPGMVRYLRQTYFTTDGLNEALTIVTYVVQGEDTFNSNWVCLNVTGHLRVGRPSEVSEAAPATGVVLQVRIDFDEGTVASSGGSHDALSHSISHNIGGIPA